MFKLKEFFRIFTLSMYKNAGNIAHYFLIFILFDWETWLEPPFSFKGWVINSRLNYLWFIPSMMIFFIWRTYRDEQKIKEIK